MTHTFELEINTITPKVKIHAEFDCDSGEFNITNTDPEVANTQYLDQLTDLFHMLTKINKNVGVIQKLEVIKIP